MRYSSKDITFELTDANNVFQDITPHVRTINGIEIEALTEESTPFGTDWVEFLGTGIAQVNPVTIEGFFDDGQGVSPVGVTPITLWVKGATRRLKITYGTTSEQVTDVVMQKFITRPILKEFTKYSMTFLPSGAQASAAPGTIT